jgi:hypothetical protein
MDMIVRIGIYVNEIGIIDLTASDVKENSLGLLGCTGMHNKPAHPMISPADIQTLFQLALTTCSSLRKRDD